MIRLCRDHGDELNDTKKSVIRCHNHSAVLANVADTLKENNHDVALLPMVENRMAQESVYLLRFRSYSG